jgi:predicted dehydrogenase
LIIGLLGAGNFTGAVILPILKKSGAYLQSIVSSSGFTGTHLGRKYGMRQSTTDANVIFSDQDINQC